jgi:hypothetical protein
VNLAAVKALELRTAQQAEEIKELKAQVAALIASQKSKQ